MKIPALLAFALAAGITARAQIPVIYYDFEAIGAGNVITNQAPSALVHGTVMGAAAQVVAGAPGSHTPGGGLLFDGVNAAGGGVRVETGFNPAGAGVNDGDYTMAAWVNFTKPTGDAMVFGQFVGTYLHLGLRNSLPHFGHHASDLADLYPLATGVWHHITWVYQGGSGSGVQRIYVNGSLTRAGGERVRMRTNDPLLIGTTQSTTTTTSFQGVLDEAVIYDQALTASQIAHLAGGGDPNALPAPELSDREFYTAPFGPGGTWHLYEVVGLRHGQVDSWWNAYQASTNLNPVIATNVPGHLVTIDGYPKNEFVRRRQHIQHPDYQLTHVDAVWLGMTDDETGLVQPTNIESGKTNVHVTVRRAAFTNWVDGTLVTYANWNGGVATNSEPNDSGVAPLGEDAIEMYANGVWNDNYSGIPGSGQETPLRDNLYIVEWPLALPEPPTGGVANVRLVEPLLPPTLPGPAGAPDSFGGYWLRTSAAITHLREGGMRHLHLAQLPGYTGTVLTTNQNLQTINAYDPQTAGNAHSLLFPNNRPYFGDLPAAADVNFLAIYKGTLRVREADAGLYTFGVHSDDGFALRIRGQRWIRAYGLGYVDPGDPSTLAYELGSGDTNTRGLIDLPAGDHDIEFVIYQGTGGSFHELYAARGDYPNDADTTEWRLVGHRQTPYGVPAVQDPGDGLGWTVWHSNPNAHGAIGNTGVAYNVVFPNYVVPDLNRTAWATINFYDPGNNLSNVGSITNSVPFPHDNPATTDINVAMYLRTTLEIPTNGTYWIGFHGDDGSWLRVEGQTWNRIAYTAIAAPGSYIEGDKIVVNTGTGNSRTIGEITLAAGEYNLDMIWFQGGGGSHLEVVGASTDNPLAILTGGPGFPLLGTGGARTEADLGGLQLVSPTPPMIEVTPVTYYENGVFEVSWNTERGATYALEWATDPGAPEGEWTPVISGLVAPENGQLSQTVPDTFGQPFVVFRVLRTDP
jgi:hypothetical protein